MNKEPTLIAIGGGGFCENVDPELEQLIINAATSRSKNKIPKVGYIGAANLDRFELISRFHRRFQTLGAETTDLSMDVELNAAEAWLHDLDALYVAGGNTQRLLEHWRKLGFENPLREAAQNGLLLSGVSAGAVCWFEYALIDTGRGKLQAQSCLGLFSGSCCPHYRSEPERQDVFEQLIKQTDIPGGIAIDDGVAVELRGDHVVGHYTARANSGALRVRAIGDKISTQIIFPAQ